MTKYSPSPWKYNNNFAVVVDANGQDICDILGPDQEELANKGAMVATAPELLESCKILLDIVRIQNGNLHADVNEIQRIAKAAIDKAEAKQP